MPSSRPAAGQAASKGDASERIALEIRRSLAERSMLPGDRIGTEQDLAAEYGVSRPTVREALRLLSSAHLIRSSRGPGGGVFVASTPSEGMSRTLSASIAALLETDDLSLRELMDARIHLEVPLAGLAAERATTETVLKLDAAIADARGHPPGSERFGLADACFHRTIAVTAGNALLRTFMSWTLDVLQPSLLGLLGDALDGELILDQHGEILRAIRRGQSAAAERAMRRHLDYMSDRLRAFEDCPDVRAAAGPLA
ncbi:MAG: FadR/GntR family transcriptional regulator [Gaiellaceae bacterium]